MELHFAKGTIAVAVAIGLEEAGVAYEPMRVDFGANEQRGAAYLALNPKGRVPVLVDGDEVLTEAGAILEYAAPALVPEGRLAQARMREVMYYLASTMHVAHAHKMRGSRWADEEASLADMKRKVPETVGACCAYLEGALVLEPFAVGDTLTCADPYLYVLLNWCDGDGVDLSDYPRLLGHFEMMSARPSVAAVREKGIL